MPGVNRLLAIPIIRFGLTGVANTALHYAVAMSFLHLVWDSPAAANGLAFIVATTFSCIVNTLWSFSRTLSRTVFRRFGIVSVLGCLLSSATAGAADLAGLSNQAGIFSSVLFVTPIIYLLHRNWTYR